MLCMYLSSFAVRRNPHFYADGFYCHKTSFYDSSMGMNRDVVYVTYGTRSNSNSSAYSGEVNIPSSVVYNGITYPVIGIADYAFENCSEITKVTIPNGVINLEQSPFYGCSGLTEITIPGSVKYIGENFFGGYSQNVKVNYEGTLAQWCDIEFDSPSSTPWMLSKLEVYINGSPLGPDLVIPEGVTKINAYAFEESKITSLTLPNSLKSIGTWAFGSCLDLVEVTIPKSVTSIGENAFTKGILFLEGETPATTGSMSYSTTTFIVPDKALDAYKSAPGWTNMQDRICPKSRAILDITTYAANGQLKLAETVGLGKEKDVASLKVRGTLNGYDLMVIRNKMKNLRILDLSDASIVADEGYEYYSACKAENDILGSHVFHGMSYLWKVVLPNNVISIGSYAFSGCNGLLSLEIPGSVKAIGSDAFQDCTNLKSVNCAEGLTTIGLGAFYRCSSLKDLKLPNTLKSIGTQAFYNCTSLVDLKLPASLERIENYAFNGCTSLSAIHLPSMLTYIGDNAFTNCGKKDVYVYTLSPFSINMNTFNFDGVLHAPQEPYSVFLDYYTNTQWSQFANVVPFEAKYSSWYMTEDQDITLNDGETIPNEDEEQAEGEMAPGSGLNYQDGAYQWLDKLNLKWKEGHAPSLIDNSSVFVDELIFTLDVKAGKWYFFCFPFDIELDKAKFNGKFVWRYYDGDERASNGVGGWKNIGGNKLNKFQGYIFQTNKSGEIELTISDPVFTGGDKNVNVESHPSSDSQNAGWNFIGNPNLSHYDLSCFIESFNCPITVWDPVNGTYNAIVPGDDDYTFSPFEAFFVQKPAGINSMTFEADNRETSNQAKASQNAKAVSRMMKAINPERLIVNLTISNGQMEDKTRVVFNDKKSLFYDEGCDAGKFLSTEDVPQIYTIDGKNVKYAINERPNNGNIVKLGYKASAEGTYTICAKRMDYQMAIKDTKTGITHNFSDGDYEFTSDAGTFDDRFVLMPSSEATNIKSLQAAGIVVESGNGYIALGGLNGKTASVYGANGVKVATITDNGRTDVAAGAYIIKVGDYSSKVVVK